jgi:hypothetical protein
MYDLTRFTEHDCAHLRQTVLARIGTGATSMEALANQLVQAFYTQFRDPVTDAPVYALIRCYITQRVDKLDSRLQALAGTALGRRPSPTMKCLVLLATAGDRPEWNDRTRSMRHQVIPLPSEEMILRFPMIAQMLQQFGFKLSAVAAGNPADLHMPEKRMHNVFYVSDAVGSPYIPAQQKFVLPYGIKSVIGMGGILPYGDVFAVILFSKVAVAETITKPFGALAIDIKGALVPFAGKTVFTPA